MPFRHPYKQNGLDIFCHIHTDLFPICYQVRDSHSPLQFHNHEYTNGQQHFVKQSYPLVINSSTVLCAVSTLSKTTDVSIRL